MPYQLSPAFEKLYFIMFHLKHGAGMWKDIFLDKLWCKTTKPAHILKSKTETYAAYLPSGASKIQFSLALQL